ncbi:putative ferulic acid Esterase/Feruloyl esterase [Piedraia hortae CBS 480.64]|uniref:Carboxylic ester hydrolase n=1 Tax=Piedraia hortae CBS 480.64 TaxID=1314780 RepID=A0A6A7BV73_9PEZI|nr:putative ferulic acid Esterase/Feruloyl esterase [Piedraia hortae CBS 480.64]
MNCSVEAFRAFLPFNTVVNWAHNVAANTTFQVPPGDLPYPVSPTGLRSLCAVEITVPSSSSSAYSFGLFLPNEWNDRFLAVGNGGVAGGINWLDMGAGVGYGFASMSTDTGHNSTDTDSCWALNEPEKIVDFGWRAMHGSVDLAKKVVKQYYKRAPKYSYYSGCSTGGRQGLRDAQLFPEDFDGILAGAPAWWTSRLQPWTVQLGLYNLPTNSKTHIPPELFPAVAAEVMRQCDGADGVVDGIISDPQSCQFRPQNLLCHPSERDQVAAKCLFPPQLITLHSIYNNYTDNGSFLFPTLELGSEAQWDVLIGDSEPNPLGYAWVQNFLLNDPNWNFWNYNSTILHLADKLQPGNCTANDFDMSLFASRGKVIMYHGLADGLIPPGSSTYFYEQVQKTMGQVDSWFRFFLVPGMQHCRGTAANAPWYFAGANQAGSINSYMYSVPSFSDAQHDALLALMAWVEQDTAPDRIIATKWVNDNPTLGVEAQRPICPYPKRATFNGRDITCPECWTC